MYNKTKEFREYIKNADDRHIEKVIEFLNVSGFIEGCEDWVYQSDDINLAEEAINFAKSEFNSVMSYLVEYHNVKYNDEF